MLYALPIIKLSTVVDPVEQREGHDFMINNGFIPAKIRCSELLSSVWKLVPL